MAMKRDSQRRVLSKWEEAMMHEQKMMEIRAAIPKRKQHRQRVEAAKKAVKEFLVLTGIGIALGLAFLYALDSDTYEPPKPEPRMIKAIGGDYYYPEDQYDEYLKERAAYIEQEEKDENSVLHFYRDILAFRKGNPLIRYGTFELLCADDPHIFAYVRTYQGKRLLVICNFSEKSQNAAAIYPNPEAIRFHNYPSITPAVLRPFELIAAL